MIVITEKQDTWPNIATIEDEPDTSIGEKLLLILSYLNNYFGADVFKRLKTTTLSSDEIAEISSTPLPSVQLSGTSLTLRLYCRCLNF